MFIRRNIQNLLEVAKLPILETKAVIRMLEIT